MKLLCMCLFYISITFRPAHSNATGPNPDACSLMVPTGHVIEPQNLGFWLTTSSSTFSPNENIEVTLSGSAYSYFRGIFLQVRDGPDLSNSFAIGSWERSTGTFYQDVDCTHVGYPPFSAFGHNSRNVKNTSTETFNWTASECVDGRQYFIKATIVVTLIEFQVNVTVPITCSNPEIPISETGSGSCLYETNIPANYNTSFESVESVAEGWEEVGVGRYAWTRNSGSTISSGTGPSNAYDGISYVYVEASHPALPGNKARLSTHTGLTGCFCFSFFYHMLIRPGFGHTLAVKIGGQTVFETRDVLDTWMKIVINVQTEQMVQIQIEATRGSHWQGDIALDDLKIIPGICNEDSIFVEL